MNTKYIHSVVAVSLITTLLGTPVFAQGSSESDRAKAELKEMTQLAQVAELLKKHKSDEAIAQLRKMDAEGNPNALAYLGYIYLNGNDIKADYPAALECFKTCAQRGNAQAKYTLGRMYFDGCGVTSDMKEAQRYFELAQTPDADFALGCMYVDGVGVKKDYASGFQYFKKAVRKNDSLAKGMVGELLYFGLGTDKNISEAMTWFLDGAKLTDLRSLFYLEKMYSTGTGVPKNTKLAKDCAARFKKRMSTVKPGNGSLGKLRFQELDNLPARYLRLQKEAASQSPASTDKTS